MAMMKRILPLILLVPFAACTSTYVEDLASEEYAPVYPAEALPEQASLPTGGIYTASSSGLFASDRRASHVGDILTVQFVERFAATKSQSASGQRSSDYEIDLPDVATLGLDDGMPLYEYIENNRVVVRVLPGGLLEIMGQKRLTLNQGKEYVRLTGIVRPEDINSENVILSDRIGNAEISYVGAGEVADTSRQGWLRRGLQAVSPL